MSLVLQLKYRCPELITIVALVVAIAAIELRREPIRLSTETGEWTLARTSYPRALRDSSDDPLIIAARPRRIVSQTLASDEILFGVCAGHRLVGVSHVALDDRYSNVVDQVRALSVPLVENVEQVVKLRPDIAFVASYSAAEQVELLRSTGIVVFRLSNFDHIGGIVSNIRAVGYAVGEDQCAANLVSRIEKRLAEIAG
jgi:iron complex transport system substrate-binding protein